MKTEEWEEKYGKIDINELFYKGREVWGKTVYYNHNGKRQYVGEAHVYEIESKDGKWYIAVGTEEGEPWWKSEEVYRSKEEAINEAEFWIDNMQESVLSLPYNWGFKEVRLSHITRIGEAPEVVIIPQNMTVLWIHRNVTYERPLLGVFIDPQTRSIIIEYREDEQEIGLYEIDYLDYEDWVKIIKNMV